jgi:GGDEF domain-containing protein
VIPKDAQASPWRSLLVEALYEGSEQLGLLVLDNRMWDYYTNEMLRRRLCTALQAINVTRHLSEMNESLQDEIERRRESEAKLNDLTEELKKLSIKDELTGLFNRRGFLTLGERQVKHYVRRRRTISYSSPIWTASRPSTIPGATWWEMRPIRAAARILETSCREADIVARLGGDEFVVLLGSAGPQHAALISTRIERAASELSRDCGADYRVSLSLGFVAASEYPGADLRELMDYADRKLYAAKKRKRRNCP